MPSTTAPATPPDTPAEQPGRVLGHADGATGEREVLVRKGGKVKGYAAVPSVEREEDVEERDDVEGKIVIRVRPTSSNSSVSANDLHQSLFACDPSHALQRILTTPLLFTLFLLLTLLTALSITTAALLALGAAYDMTPFWGLLRLRMRGTGLEAMWIALVGGWTGLAGMLFVSWVSVALVEKSEVWIWKDAPIEGRV